MSRLQIIVESMSSEFQAFTVFLKGFQSFVSGLSSSGRFFFSSASVSGEDIASAVNGYLAHSSNIPDQFIIAITEYLAEAKDKQFKDVAKCYQAFASVRLKDISLLAEDVQGLVLYDSLDDLMRLIQLLMKHDVIAEYVSVDLKKKLLDAYQTIIPSPYRDQPAYKQWIGTVTEESLVACLPSMLQRIEGLMVFRLNETPFSFDINNGNLLSKFDLVSNYDAEASYDDYFSCDEQRENLELVLHIGGRDLVVESSADQFKEGLFHGALALAKDEDKSLINNMMAVFETSGLDKIWLQFFKTFMPQRLLENKKVFTQHAFTYQLAFLFLGKLRIRHGHKLIMRLNEENPSHIQIEVCQIVTSVRLQDEGVEDVIEFSEAELGGPIANISACYDITHSFDEPLHYGVSFHVKDYTASKFLFQHFRDKDLLADGKVVLAAVNGNVTDLVSLVLRDNENVNEVVSPSQVKVLFTPSKSAFRGADGKVDEAFYSRTLEAYQLNLLCDEEGLSALHLAVLGNHFNAIKACIALGAHLHSFNDGMFHETAYDLAVRIHGDQSKISQFLKAEYLKQSAYLFMKKGVVRNSTVGLCYEIKGGSRVGVLKCASYAIDPDALLFESVEAINQSDDFPYQAVFVRYAKALSDKLQAITDELKNLCINVESSNINIECDVLGERLVAIKQHVLINTVSLSATRASLMPGVDYVSDVGGPLAVYMFKRIVQLDASDEVIASHDTVSLQDLTEVGFFTAMKSIGLLDLRVGEEDVASQAGSVGLDASESEAALPSIIPARNLYGLMGRGSSEKLVHSGAGALALGAS